MQLMKNTFDRYISHDILRGLEKFNGSNDKRKDDNKINHQQAEMRHNR